MTDTSLDLDAIERRIRNLEPYIDADTTLALVGALRKAEAQVAAVLALHKPWRIYDECDCTDEQKADPDRQHVEVDEVGTTCAVMYVACRECCSEGGDGEYHAEECATYHEHAMDESDRCATVRAIGGAS